MQRLVSPAPILEYNHGSMVVSSCRFEATTVDGRKASSQLSPLLRFARRAGAMAPRLFSLLSGTETPVYVAAIMSWFHDDPRRLAGATPMKIAGHLEVKGFGSADQMISDQRIGQQLRCR